MSVDIDGYLEKWREEADCFLSGHLDSCEAPERLLEGMRYALLGKGKRIRPILAIASARCVGGVQQTVLPAACAMEMIHAYSLVHDDLPAMDDDELRRGKPTAHVAFGEASAILIGDALLSEAFVILGDLSLHQGIYAHELLEVCGYVAKAIGAEGMVGGQFLDIESQGSEPDEELMKRIHRDKTTRLIQASTYMGARLGGGTEKEIKSLTNFGQKYGLAFQIVDDVLAEVGTSDETGKVQGRDRALGKVNAVAVYGVARAAEIARGFIDEAIVSLERFDERADVLTGIARKTLARINQ